MTTTIIEVKDLIKTFNAGKNNEVSPVNRVSFDIPAGSCTVLKGASGSGKTTLMSILGGLAKPSAGEYICLGKAVSRWSEKFLTRFRRKHLGIIFQHFHLVSGFSVETNIALPLIPLGWGQPQIKRRVKEVAEQVDILHRLGFKIDTLSGGELQRVAIARALVNDPSILLADEPTAHLDSARAQHILSIFSDLKQQGKTLLITTHDPQVEAHPIVDQKLIMQDGRLV